MAEAVPGEPRRSYLDIMLNHQGGEDSSDSENDQDHAKARKEAEGTEHSEHSAEARSSVLPRQSEGEMGSSGGAPESEIVLRLAKAPPPYIEDAETRDPIEVRIQSRTRTVRVQNAKPGSSLETMMIILAQEYLISEWDPRKIPTVLDLGTDGRRSDVMALLQDAERLLEHPIAKAHVEKRYFKPFVNPKPPTAKVGFFSCCLHKVAQSTMRRRKADHIRRSTCALQVDPPPAHCVVCKNNPLSGKTPFQGLLLLVLEVRQGRSREDKPARLWYCPECDSVYRVCNQCHPARLVPCIIFQKHWDLVHSIWKGGPRGMDPIATAYFSQGSAMQPMRSTPQSPSQYSREAMGVSNLAAMLKPKQTGVGAFQPSTTAAPTSNPAAALSEGGSAVSQTPGPADRLAQVISGLQLLETQCCGLLSPLASLQNAGPTIQALQNNLKALCGHIQATGILASAAQVAFRPPSTTSPMAPPAYTQPVAFPPGAVSTCAPLRQDPKVSTSAALNLPSLPPRVFSSTTSIAPSVRRVGFTGQLPYSTSPSSRAFSAHITPATQSTVSARPISVGSSSIPVPLHHSSYSGTASAPLPAGTSTTAGGKSAPKRPPSRGAVGLGSDSDAVALQGHSVMPSSAGAATRHGHDFVDKGDSITSDLAEPGGDRNGKRQRIQ